MADEASSAPVRGVIGVVAVIAGIALLVWGFLGGIDSALNGGGSGASPIFFVMFFVGAFLVLAALILAIVRLVQGRNRGLAILTIVLAIIPIAGVIALRAAALV